LPAAEGPNMLMIFACPSINRKISCFVVCIVIAVVSKQLHIKKKKAKVNYINSITIKNGKIGYNSMVTKSLLYSQKNTEDKYFSLTDSQTAKFLEKSGYAPNIKACIRCVFDVSFENVDPNTRLDTAFIYTDNLSHRDVCVDIVAFNTNLKDNEYELRVYQIGRRREIQPEPDYMIHLEALNKKILDGTNIILKGKECIASISEFISKVKEEIIFYLFPICSNILQIILPTVLENCKNEDDVKFEIISYWPEEYTPICKKMNCMDNLWVKFMRSRMESGIIILRDNKDVFWGNGAVTVEELMGCKIEDRELARKLKIILQCIRGSSYFLDPDASTENEVK